MQSGARREFISCKNITVGFHPKYNAPHKSLCAHPWPLVYNTVSSKPMIVHLVVHSNHWNVTFGTESCTLLVNFDQMVHPITLRKISSSRKPFALESVDSVFGNAFLTLMRTRGLESYFSHLWSHFFWQKTKKNIGS